MSSWGWSGAPLLPLMQGTFLLDAAIGLASAMIDRRIEEPRSSARSMRGVSRLVRHAASSIASRRCSA